MKNAVALALSFSLAVLPASAVTASPLIPVAAAKAVFARAHALCGADDGRLWGVSLCGPLMLADPRTHAALSNVPVPGAERVAGLYRFTLPREAPVSDTWFDYEGIRLQSVIGPTCADQGRHFNAFKKWPFAAQSASSSRWTSLSPGSPQPA
jgi:hypothetical protein